MNSQIIITGSAGAGKSTIGKSLSKITGLSVRDIDYELKTMVCSETIQDLTSYSIIAGFESLLAQEHLAFKRLLDLSSCTSIITTSGNTLLEETNRTLLQSYQKDKKALVVYLYLPPREAIKRILSDKENINDRFSEDFKKKFGIEGMITAILKKNLKSHSVRYPYYWTQLV